MTEISLEEAKSIAERLEKANGVSQELIERAEKLRTMDILGGKSQTSEPKEEVPEEEKVKQQAKEFFKGSNVEEALNKYG